MTRMKPGPKRTAIWIGAIVCGLGLIGYGIAFAILMLTDAIHAAMPFAWVGFFLSLPSVLFAGNPFENPFWGALLPVTLVLNSLLIALVVWAFLKVKVVVHRAVYGIEKLERIRPNQHFEATR